MWRKKKGEHFYAISVKWPFCIEKKNDMKNHLESPYLSKHSSRFCHFKWYDYPNHSIIINHTIEPGITKKASLSMCQLPKCSLFFTLQKIYTFKRQLKV